MAKSNGHWDTNRQKLKGLPGLDQLGSQVYQEQKIHLTDSEGCQSKIIHTNATGGTTSKQGIATTK